MVGRNSRLLFLVVMFAVACAPAPSATVSSQRATVASTARDGTILAVRLAVNDQGVLDAPAVATRNRSYVPARLYVEGGTNVRGATGHGYAAQVEINPAAGRELGSAVTASDLASVTVTVFRDDKYSTSAWTPTSGDAKLELASVNGVLRGSFVGTASGTAGSFRVRLDLAVELPPT